MRSRLLALAVASLFVVPTFLCRADTLEEDFSSDPAAHGWRAFGQTNLFHWNPTNQDLEVTWDTSQTNSYYCRPLGNVLAIEDTFALEFDLQLRDIQWTNVYELAIGLFNLENAISPDFSRGTANSPNLFEFDYFPDDGANPSGVEPNVAATMTDMGVNATNMSGFDFIYDTKPLSLGVTYHIKLMHAGGDHFLSGNVFTNGQLYSSMPLSYPGPIHDVRLDAVAVMSYTADPYGDTLLAHGAVDNFRVTLPPPPVTDLRGGFSNTVWQAQFVSRTNWLYTLERTRDFQNWTAASAAASGNGTNLLLQDLAPPGGSAFYRVRANRP